MKRLPQIDTDCSDLYKTIYAPVQNRLLLAAVELGIFDLLSDPVPAGDIARALAAHLGNTRAFLDALVSCGYLEKRNGRYRNNKTADAFLKKNSPTYLGDFIANASQMMLGGLDDLPDLIKKGPKPQPQDQGDTGMQWAKIADPMTRYSLCGKAQQMAGIMSRLPEFAAFRTMLDLGGSTGAYAMAMIEAHPDMVAVIFDQPAVLDVARTTIAQFECQDRIRLMGGDVSHDSIGGGYDFIWTSATLNFFRTDLDRVMNQIYAALNPGGVFACLQDGLKEERTQPKAVVLPMLAWALTGNDIRFDQGEIADVMLQTGFKSVHSQTITTTDGPMDLDIGRKSLE